MAINQRAVVSWTGGKDCNLALFEAKRMGYEIVGLVTFAMSKPRFKAHPIAIMEKQAEALGIPHVVIVISIPYKVSYENAIVELKRKFDINTIITGDIAEIDGNINWMKECATPGGVNVFLPLWHLNRQQILKKLLELRFKIIFSCVKEPWFSVDWLGKELTYDVVSELIKIHELNGLDICGEQGEYHTLVLDGPFYNNEIVIDSFKTEMNDSIIHMEIKNILITEKTNSNFKN